MKTKSKVKKPKGRATPADANPQVIFRLSKGEFEDLSERAEETGQKPNLLARDWTLKTLYPEDDPEEKQEDATRSIERLSRQMEELREKLALVAEALLTHGGKMATEQAGKWVDQNLIPR